MSGSRVRTLLVVVPALAAASAIARTLRGGPAPVFSRPPVEPEERLRFADPPGRPPVAGGPPARPTRTTHPAPATPASGTVDPASVLASDAAGQTWVLPVAGVCPEGHPVKAKTKSGIFHLPGGLSYERTNADCCYPSAAAAEADGFRAAKR